MISAFVDSVLAHLSAKLHRRLADCALPTRRIETPVGIVRLFDSGSAKPCVIMVPDGPNVIEHYAVLIDLLSRQLRVVCFDMPGFGYSFPRPSYKHGLDQGARAVLGVMDNLGINTATLAFSCANGFYALRTAKMAPERISHLVLSQTPSLAAMHAWARQTIPPLLHIPVIGQIAAWLFRKKAAHSWYRKALPKTTNSQPFQDKGLDALSGGGCFCLAGVVQSLMCEKAETFTGVTTPCTVIWGTQDRSHKYTESTSLLGWVPHADIVYFEDCGHFPDVEQPSRFAEIIVERTKCEG